MWVKSHHSRVSFSFSLPFFTPSTPPSFPFLANFHHLFKSFQELFSISMICNQFIPHLHLVPPALNMEHILSTYKRFAVTFNYLIFNPLNIIFYRLLGNLIIHRPFYYKLFNLSSHFYTIFIDFSSQQIEFHLLSSTSLIIHSPLLYPLVDLQFTILLRTPSTRLSHYASSSASSTLSSMHSASSS